MDAPSWSQNQLKRLGRHISAGAAPQSSGPTYEAVLEWYNDLAAEVQGVISETDWTPILGARTVELTSRAKTLDTLRQKLLRDSATPLASVQDIAGVRFEAEMSLDEQDAIAHRIAELFSHDPSVCVHDLRSRPHSGYRAVHVWLRLPAGRVEVQVRTHLQGAWANAYESLADAFGREIRYGYIPLDPQEAMIVRSLQDVSLVRIAEMEGGRNDAARLKAEYVNTLQTLDEYDDEDTLPHHLVNAQEADVRVGELQREAAEDERTIRGALQDLKRIFDSMNRERR